MDAVGIYTVLTIVSIVSISLQEVKEMSDYVVRDVNDRKICEINNPEWYKMIGENHIFYCAGMHVKFDNTYRVTCG